MSDLFKLACWACLLTCGVAAITFSREPTVDVVAGTGNSENNGDEGPAASINIGSPFGVEIGPDSALYITEVHNHRVRRLDLATRKVTTVAGCGRRGYSGNGGLAVDAAMNEPYEVRFDRDGNMFVVEMMNHIVRRVDAKTKKIETVAGNGQSGFSGDGGPAINALLDHPHSIAIDEQGAVYIADIGNHRIRRIDSKSGIIDSIAGNAQQKPPRDGQAARDNPILGPRALFIDGQTLWIALREGHSVWRMNLMDGILHHVAGTGQAGYAGDGGPVMKAKFNGPKGIAVATKQYVFVTDSENNVIRRIDLKSGSIATVAGGESEESMRLKQPHGVYVGADGAIFIGDTLNHRVLKVR